MLKLRADTRLRDVQYFTGSSQTPFLGDGPKIEQMMVIKITWCHLAFLEHIVRFFILSQPIGQGDNL
jgi:hypothetical protein